MQMLKLAFLMSASLLTSFLMISSSDAQDQGAGGISFVDYMSKGYRPYGICGDAGLYREGIEASGGDGDNWRALVISSEQNSVDVRFCVEPEGQSESPAQIRWKRLVDGKAVEWTSKHFRGECANLFGITELWWQVTPQGQANHTARGYLCSARSKSYPEGDAVWGAPPGFSEAQQGILCSPGGLKSNFKSAEVRQQEFKTIGDSADNDRDLLICVPGTSESPADVRWSINGQGGPKQLTGVRNSCILFYAVQSVAWRVSIQPGSHKSKGYYCTQAAP